MLIDSFNPVQSVLVVSHIGPCTFYTLPVTNLEIHNTVLSNHIPLIFETVFTCTAVNPHASAVKLLTPPLSVSSLWLLTGSVLQIKLMQRSLVLGEIACTSSNV